MLTVATSYTFTFHKHPDQFNFLRIKMSVIVFAAIGFSIYFVYKKWFKTDKDEDHSSQEVQTRIVRSQEECSAAIRMLKSYVM